MGFFMGVKIGVSGIERFREVQGVCFRMDPLQMIKVKGAGVALHLCYELATGCRKGLARLLWVSYTLQVPLLTRVMHYLQGEGKL
jgi:hypothetical protein